MEHSGNSFASGLDLICQETVSTSREADRSVATVVEVIVTGSNIPTAEEVGPNPVDTYRPADIEKLGIRNATDLTTFLPQEAGGTVNLNSAMVVTGPSN